MSFAQDGLGPGLFLWRNYHRDDFLTDGVGGGFGCSVSELQGCKPEQDRQRFWRNAVPGVKLSLHSWLRVVARHWDGRFSRSCGMDCGKHLNLLRVVGARRLAANETGTEAAAENRVLRDVPDAGAR